MLLQELTLTNFGIYKGHHRVDLTADQQRPIVLFGGLNGGGKTTFLDALQLVLYGKHAKCSNRGHQAYGNFLSNARNHYTDSDEATELTLTFSHTTDREEQIYQVQRSWQVARQPENTRDKVTVRCNGEIDIHISQYWDDFVNEFIPLSLSDLFFFDGEKIEHLAHSDRSAELIRTGLENLLGLDLLTQLRLDLNNVEKKRRERESDQETQIKLEKYAEELSTVAGQIAVVKKDIAQLEKEASDTNVTINKVRQEVRHSGAHLLEERDNLNFEKATIEQQLKDNLQQRVRLDAGCGPLGLVKDLIKETRQQAEKEQAAKQALIVDSAIKEYEQQLLSVLQPHQLPDELADSLSQTMQNMAEQRQALASTECYINLPPSIFDGLDEKLEQDAKERKALAEQREILQEQVALLEKKLESIPDFETVEHLLTKLAQQEERFRNHHILISKNKTELQRLEAWENTLNARYTNLLTQQNKNDFEAKRSDQVSLHIDKIKATMQSFANTLVLENITLLQDKIAEKFIGLTRKDGLINHITICKDSFDLTLFDLNDQPLNPDRLSAGERQLLAIAILWALAETSGRELPTVIDTPLGRLDGKHRSLLIENYFPKAAKQVLLLSTDEEITGDYYSRLKPAISREYHIQYNEKDRTSTISEGYFS